MKDDGRLIMLYVVLFVMIPVLAMAQDDNSTSVGKRLKILIPVRNFTDFVTIKKDNITEQYSFDGFAIQVFQTVMNNIVPDPILFDFIPFAKTDGTMNGTFDDMLRSVSAKDYDGAVGEISILYSRTQWVDFTMPYLDTSISMLVRLRDDPKTTLIPLGRVTKYVVVSSLAFSFIVALLFWCLEYRNDKHASPNTVAYASPGQSPTNHDDSWRREILESMIQTRLVMILFFMVLIVVIACYTASQTTTLTSHRPRGSSQNLEQLMRDGANVGYRQGSFIRDMLVTKGIDGSKLISLDADEELVSALSKGTANGGVDAIVADSPTLNILVAKHCDVFTIVPTYNLHAAGFGFAFYKGFEQLDEISKGILRIIEYPQMAAIQERTIGNLQGCENHPNADSAYLDSDTIWILIAGAVTVFLLVCIVLLIYCGRTRRKTKTKKAIAYPCYLSPCC